MISQPIAELGGVDVLVNNAGIQISRLSAELSGADFDKVLAVNNQCLTPIVKTTAAESRLAGLRAVSVKNGVRHRS